MIEAVKEPNPDIDAVIVEPDGRDKLRQSLAGGGVTPLPPSPTIMDALAGPTSGLKTCAALRRHRVRAVTVTDEQATHAMVAASETLRIVVEPGGAAALAAALAGKSIAGRTVVVVASGGNVDPALLSQALSAK